MPIELPLTQGYLTTIDEVDHLLAVHKWYAGRHESRVYVQRHISVNGSQRSVWLHRSVLECAIGRPLEQGEYVDHIDGNTLNNCRSNLRLCNKSQNSQNRGTQVNNTSGFKGVAWYKAGKKWGASITLRHKQRHLGYFDTAIEAHQAYLVAAAELFGEFAPAPERTIRR